MPILRVMTSAHRPSRGKTSISVEPSRFLAVSRREVPETWCASMAAATSTKAPRQAARRDNPVKPIRGILYGLLFTFLVAGIAIAATRVSVPMQPPAPPAVTAEQKLQVQLA